MSIDKVIAEFLLGKERALAKLITQVEGSPALVNEIFAGIGRDLDGKSSRVIGFTGPPGAGKSSLVDSVIKVLRSRGRRVGVIAVDPTSPFTGGAMLGDRIRMESHYLDPDVFIRSLGTRRGVGGLSPATKHVVRLMRLFGFDDILVETVGVGQTELDVMIAVDTVVVVLVPEAGDSIQTMKAGLMEIGDVFVVNKSDRPGCAEIRASLLSMLQLTRKHGGWIPGVLATRADRDEGSVQLVDAIDQHTLYLSTSGELATRREFRQERELLEMLSVHFAQIWSDLKNKSELHALAMEVVNRRADLGLFAKSLVDATAKGADTAA